VRDLVSILERESGTRWTSAGSPAPANPSRPSTMPAERLASLSQPGGILAPDGKGVWVANGQRFWKAVLCPPGPCIEGEALVIPSPPPSSTVGQGEAQLFLADDGERWVVDVGTGSVRHLQLSELSPGAVPGRPCSSPTSSSTGRRLGRPCSSLGGRGSSNANSSSIDPKKASSAYCPSGSATSTEWPSLEAPNARQRRGCQARMQTPEKPEDEEAAAAWRIHFFQSHRDDDSARTAPARDFLDRCPTGVAADIIVTLRSLGREFLSRTPRSVAR
jgi:hypothetical protein